jgi:DNA polymerase-1
VILVDALALVYRAHYALNGKRRDRRGFDVGATEMVRGNLEEIMNWGDEVHLAWDCVGGRTFRHELFPEYKGHRKEMPAPLAGQLPWIRRIAEDLGMVSWRAPGFEADDVMATLAAMADPAEVQIVTPDKDMLQLVTDRVRCSWFDTSKHRDGNRWTVWGPEGVEDRMGVRPALVPDLLALMGDACDGLPGLAGVGPKRAVALLEKWGSAQVAAHQAGAFSGAGVGIALELVRLRTDAPVEVWA